MGGLISSAKALWLYWTVSVWFFILPLLLYFWHWPPGVKLPILFLTSSMWIRGILEVYMLFVSKNWIPPFGITHNLFTFVGMIILLLLNFESLRAASFSSILFMLTMMISLLVETHYAKAFFTIVKNRTKGDEGVWYADSENPVFKKVIKLTARWNIFFYAITTYFILELAFL